MKEYEYPQRCQHSGPNHIYGLRTITSAFFSWKGPLPKLHVFTILLHVRESSISNHCNPPFLSSVRSIIYYSCHLSGLSSIFPVICQVCHLSFLSSLKAIICTSCHMSVVSSIIPSICREYFLSLLSIVNFRKSPLGDITISYWGKVDLFNKKVHITSNSLN